MRESKLSSQSDHPRSVKISLHEFRQFMETYGATELHQIGQEYAFYAPLTFTREYSGDPIYIEILSSISTWNNWSRDRAEDAIRLRLKFRDKVIITRTAYRTHGWQQRMEAKISELRGLIAPHLLCRHGHPLRVRFNRQTEEPFWGCVLYPECRSTRPFR